MRNTPAAEQNGQTRAVYRTIPPELPPEFPRLLIKTSTKCAGVPPIHGTKRPCRSRVQPLDQPANVSGSWSLEQDRRLNDNSDADIRRADSLHETEPARNETTSQKPCPTGERKRLASIEQDRRLNDNSDADIRRAGFPAERTACLYSHLSLSDHRVLARGLEPASGEDVIARGREMDAVHAVGLGAKAR